MAVHLGLHDLEIDIARWQIDSPRSLQACQKAGIDTTDLIELPISNFQASGVPDQISQLRWTQAKDRVARNRKLVRRYHALEVNAPALVHCATRSWAKTIPEPTNIPAVAAISRRVHDLQHRSDTLAKARTHAIIDTAVHFTALQERADVQGYEHFSSNVQGPRVTHKKQVLKCKAAGGLHNPQGHVLRRTQDEKLIAAERLLAQSKDAALLALEQCDQEQKNERALQRKVLVSEFSQSRDAKLKKAKEVHTRSLEAKKSQKKDLLMRSENMSKLATACVKKKKQQEVLRVQMQMEKDQMRADQGLMTQLNHQELRRQTLIRKHKLDDLKHEHLQLVRSERQRQNQMRMRAREMRAQERAQQERLSRITRADKVLANMGEADKRLMALRQDQAAHTELHREKNRLQHEERMQRKADIERWALLEQEQLRDASKVKEQYSDHILRSKEALAHVISRGKVKRLKDRDREFDQLLMSQTTGSWAELEHKSKVRSGLADTAPIRAFSCPPLDKEYDVKFSTTATATQMDFSGDFDGNTEEFLTLPELDPVGQIEDAVFDGTVELPSKPVEPTESADDEGSSHLFTMVGLLSLPNHEEEAESTQESGNVAEAEKDSKPLKEKEAPEEEPLEPQHLHVVS